MAKNQSQGGSSSSSDDVFYLVGGGICLLLMLWFLFWKQGIVAVLWIAKIEQWLVAPFSVLFTADQAAKWAKWQAFLAANGGGKVNSFWTAVAALRISGEWIRWHVLVVAGLAAWWVFRTNPVWKYRRTLSLEMLIAYNVLIWPRMRVIAELTGLGEEIKRGPFKRPLQPHEVALKFGGLKIESAKDRNGRIQFSETPGVFSPGAIYKGYADSLGRPWNNGESLKFHERAIFAIFCARILNSPESSTELLDCLGAGVRWSPKEDTKIGFALKNEHIKLIDSIVARALADAEIKSICDKHHYVNTVMTALLERTRRQHESIATVDFKWLKICDRTLFLALNQVGRRVRWSEAAGVWAHYECEVLLKKAIPDPAVVMAVTALFDALWRELYVDDEYAQIIDGENVKVFKAHDEVFDEVRNVASVNAKLIKAVRDAVVAAGS